MEGIPCINSTFTVGRRVTAKDNAHTVDFGEILTRIRRSRPVASKTRLAWEIDAIVRKPGNALSPPALCALATTATHSRHQKLLEASSTFPVRTRQAGAESGTGAGYQLRDDLVGPRGSVSFSTEIVDVLALVAGFQDVEKGDEPISRMASIDGPASTYESHYTSPMAFPKGATPPALHPLYRRIRGMDRRATIRVRRVRVLARRTLETRIHSLCAQVGHQ